MFTTTATKLPRLMNCHGSAVIEPSFPNVDTDRTDRDEGDAAHWAAKAVFDGQYQIEELVERKAPNGVHITPDMIEHVASYLSGIQPGAMEVETSFGTDEWRVNARADHIYYDVTANILYIDDFKYGWRVVEPERNWTLIAHAIGFCISHQITPAEIVMTIHQPRPQHRDGLRREWRMFFGQLCLYHDEICAVMSGPKTELRSGVEWCGGCYAVATCPAAIKAGFNAIDAVENSVFNETITDAQLSYALDLMRQSEATLANRKTALEELAKYRLTGGAVVANYGLDKQYSHRRFKPGVDASMLNAMFGIDASKPGLVTPAEFERRGANSDILQLFTERVATGIKLVRVSAHKRASRALGRK